jgi:hypothetical protein
LLASEQHGVRYARHWLDVLRYAVAPGRRTQPAAITTLAATRSGWPAAGSRGAPSTGRPTSSATGPSRTAPTTAICTPRSSGSSVSITRR